MKAIRLKADNFKYVPHSPDDERDIIYTTSNPIVEEHSLEQFRGPILDQGSYGACTGFGTAGMLRSYFKRLTDQDVDFDPWFIYYNSRSRSGWRYKDEGAYPREVFNSLIHDGVIEDDTWEPKDKIKEDPPKFGDMDLIKFKSYKRFQLSNIDQIRKDFSNCIGTEMIPIGIAMKIYANATDEANFSGVFNYKPNDKDVGGHWVYADKVDSNGLTIVNSWSRNWGKKGTALIPWDQFSKFVFEAWSLDPELP